MPNTTTTHRQTPTEPGQFRCADTACTERFDSRSERFAHYAAQPEHATTSRYSFDPAPATPGDGFEVAFDAPPSFPASTAHRNPWDEAEPEIEDFDGVEVPAATPTADVEKWLLALGRKVELDDMNEALRLAATKWAQTWEGDFEYMRDMKTQAVNYPTKGLSTAQAKGTLNCWRADLIRNQPKPEAAAAPAGGGLDLTVLPQGAHGVLHTAVQDTKTGDWLFINIKVRNSGLVVTQEVGGHEDLFLGGQRHGQTYTGKRTAELEVILADPKAAYANYTAQSERCAICNTKLSAKESLERAMGPTCAGKAGF